MKKFDFHTSYEDAAERKFWFKLAYLSIITIFLINKLWNADISIQELEYTSLLSLIIAIFAICISIAFYLKVSQMSSKLYDDAYQFNKDISETIGRMEVRFSERLRNLGGETSPSIDKQFIPSEDLKAMRELEKEKEVCERLIKEKDALISDLLNASNLESAEKEDYKNQINALSADLNKLRDHIQDLEQERTLTADEIEWLNELMDDTNRIILRDIVNFYSDMINDPAYLERMKSEIASNLRIRPGSAAHTSMEHSTLIDSSGTLTERAVDYLLRTVSTSHLR